MPKVSTAMDVPLQSRSSKSFAHFPFLSISLSFNPFKLFPITSSTIKKYPYSFSRKLLDCQIPCFLLLLFFYISPFICNTSIAYNHSNDGFNLILNSSFKKYKLSYLICHVLEELRCF